jgi:hypothetical protein
MDANGLRTDVAGAWMWRRRADRRYLIATNAATAATAMTGIAIPAEAPPLSAGAVSGWIKPLFGSPEEVVLADDKAEGLPESPTVLVALAV